MRGKACAAVGVATLTWILVLFASAADAQPVGTVPSWEGFYLGAALGYGSGDANVKQPPSAVFYNAEPLDLGFIGSDGVSGGVLAGYNYMLTPRWILGIEGDANWSNVANNDVYNDGFGDILTLKLWQSSAYSARARVGYLVTPDTLLYGTGGWSWSWFTYSAVSSSLGIAESYAGWFNGAQVGAGVETMVAPGWIARLEYLQSLYGRRTFNSSTFGPLEVRPSVGVGRLALIYRFGPGDAVPAQTAPPHPSWNGLYAGGELGAGVGTAGLDFSQALGSRGDLGITGAFPALLIGYNWRVAPRIVLGAEGEVEPGISSGEFRLGWTKEARGRVGYLLTPATMLYGSVGWLGTAIDTTSIINDTIAVPAQQVNAVEMGGGLEMALTGQLAARFDYQYAVAMPLDDIVLDIGTITGPVSAHPRMQTARLGLVYMFGGP